MTQDEMQQMVNAEFARQFGPVREAFDREWAALAALEAQNFDAAVTAARRTGRLIEGSDTEQ